MREQLERIKAEALQQMEAADTLDKLNEIRVAYLGKKGELTSVLKSMKNVAPEERPMVGQMVNEARELIEAKLEETKTTLARKAREAAKKARDNAREKNKKKEKALKFDSKLADCWSKDRSKCELYITEGDSASGNLKTARNNEFQAVMPVRGKILNTQKATLDKIQKNAEIMTMIEAFGLTIDPKTMKITYRKEDLRYGKIIIMSDADVDGAHIKNLFYTFIWNFCPQLIHDGYIYAGVPPLYKVTIGKKYKYIKNDEELEQFRKENVGKNYVVNRMKGYELVWPLATLPLIRGVA